MLWKKLIATSLICLSQAAYGCSYEQAEHLLALNAYHEARGEGFIGMLAVSSVVLHRKDSKGYPDDICKVITQPSRKASKPWKCQFSWTCSKSAVKPPPKAVQVPLRASINTLEQRAWNKARAVARLTLMGGYGLYKAGIPATMYYACQGRNKIKKPAWDWTKLVFVGKIGNHCFYAEKVN